MCWKISQEIERCASRKEHMASDGRSTVIHEAPRQAECHLGIQNQSSAPSPVQSSWVSSEWEAPTKERVESLKNDALPHYCGRIPPASSRFVQRSQLEESWLKTRRGLVGLLQLLRHVQLWHSDSVENEWMGVWRANKTLTLITLANIFYSFVFVSTFCDASVILSHGIFIFMLRFWIGATWGLRKLFLHLPISHLIFSLTPYLFRRYLPISSTDSIFQLSHLVIFLPHKLLSLHSHLSNPPIFNLLIFLSSGDRATSDDFRLRSLL